jgi:hypothetical protein
MRLGGWVRGKGEEGRREKFPPDLSSYDQTAEKLLGPGRVLGKAKNSYTKTHPHAVTTKTRPHTRELSELQIFLMGMLLFISFFLYLP